MAQRVERLLDKTRHRGTRLLKSRLAVMVAVLGVTAWVAGRTPALVAFAMPQSPAQQVAAPRALQPVAAPAQEPEAPGPAPEPTPAPAPAVPAVPQTLASRPVLVPVTVTDPQNRFVTGLGRESFRLFEDGVEQQIAQLSTDDAPISMGIVLDASGSMGRKVESARSTVSELLRNANSADEFFLVTFNENPILAVPFTTDPQAIETGLSYVQARGGTSLRDGVHMALEQMRQAHNSRKALLIISDSQDNSSIRSAAELRSELDTSEALVYSLNISDSTAPLRDAWVIGQVTTIDPGAREAFRDFGARLIVGLRNRYVLTYTSNRPSAERTYHRIQVQIVTPAGLPPLTLHYRTGYYE